MVVDTVKEKSGLGRNEDTVVLLPAQFRDDPIYIKMLLYVKE